MRHNHLGRHHSEFATWYANWKAKQGKTIYRVENATYIPFGTTTTHWIPLGGNFLLETNANEDGLEFTCTGEIVKVTGTFPHIPPIEVVSLAHRICGVWLKMERHSDGVWWWALEREQPTCQNTEPPTTSSQLKRG